MRESRWKGHQANVLCVLVSLLSFASFCLVYCQKLSAGIKTMWPLPRRGGHKIVIYLSGGRKFYLVATRSLSEEITAAILSGGHMISLPSDWIKYPALSMIYSLDPHYSGFLSSAML